jgi:N-formylglutamate amidohydrolase
LTRLLYLSVVALLACTGASQPAEPRTGDTLIVLAGANQTATVATAVAIDPVVLLHDGGGTPRRNIAVTIEPEEGSGWVVLPNTTTDSAGRASVRWYLGVQPGPHRLRMRAADVSATIDAAATPLQPGVTYLGRNGYVEFRAGDQPIVFTAPHGGTLQPAEIPDRTVGETVRDANTDQLAEEVQAAFASMNLRPHVLIVRLHRRKLDANREIVEGAQANPYAEIAWKEFHGFIDAAREAARSSASPITLFDLHGHGHVIPRLELGYLLSGAQLMQSDAELNRLAAQTSVAGLVAASGRTLAELLRGPLSLGALFEQQGFPAVPGPTHKDPAADPYFSGGFITERYGLRHPFRSDAVQIEAHFTGVRDTETNRRRFAQALVTVLLRFRQHYPR